MMETIKQKAIRVWLSRSLPEAAVKYQVARRTAASVIVDVKTQAWAWRGAFGWPCLADESITIVIEVIKSSPVAPQ